MTDTTCLRCERPMPDQAYACPGCIRRAGGQLAAIVDMTPAARDIAHGQNRGGDGGTSGKPGSRLPLNLTATAKLDGVQAELTTWVRHITEQRGGQPRTVGSDPIVHSAWYLTAQLEWMRHRREADEFLEDVAACARIVGGLARGPREQKYLGPCGLPAQVETTTYEDLAAGRRTFVDGKPCEGDIYAPVYSDGTTARTGTCRTCRATVATDDRAAWLDGKVRARAFRAVEIADAYGVSVKTIRTWAARGQLRTYWRTSGNLVTPWTDLEPAPDLKGEALAARLAEIDEELAARGPRLHYVGEVLDLFRALAVRRAEEEAKRARRAAARAAEKAESEGAAA